MKRATAFDLAVAALGVTLCGVIAVGGLLLARAVARIARGAP